MLGRRSPSPAAPAPLAAEAGKLPAAAPAVARARTVTADMPLHQRAHHYATAIGRNADPATPRGHRYRHNAFCDSPLGPEITGVALSLEWVLGIVPTAPELAPYHAASDAPGNLLATVLAAVSDNAAGATGDDDDNDDASASDCSLYTGSGSAAHALFKVHVADPGATIPATGAPRLDGRSPLSVAEELTDTAAAAAISATAARRSGRQHRSAPYVSTLLSPVGVLTLAAAVHKHTGSTETSRTLAQRALDHARAHAFSPTTPSEVLYGRAGLLHALQWLGALNLPDTSPAARALIKDVLEAVVEDGRRTARTLGVDGDTPLLWAWHDRVYLGAAHGAAGILTVLLSMDHVDVAPYAGEVLAAVEFLTSFDGYPVKLQITPSSTHPSATVEPIYGTRREHDSEVVVQWCHGAVGFGLMYLAAWRFLATSKDDESPTATDFDLERVESGDAGQAHDATAYLQRAVACGEVAWQRGILHKHVGLCHGVCGNAYLFLGLWSATGDRTWYQRALAFAAVAAHWHGGASDHPFSTWEGFGGLAWLLADLVMVERWMRMNPAGGATRPWIGFPGVNDGALAHEAGEEASGEAGEVVEEMEMAGAR